MPLQSLQAAVPQASLAVPASLQAGLLDVKQSPILCSDGVIRIVTENPQLNRSTSSELSDDAPATRTYSWCVDCQFVVLGSAVSHSFLTAPLFLNHCNWRL